MNGLYLHVPFCLQKCHYCNFVITLDRRESQRERFFAALFKEIDQTKNRYGRLRFDTFYLGGGTPSLLAYGELERLVAYIHEHFDFKPGFEFTCEFNPGDADLEKIRNFKKCGINRISLGAQAFQDHLLRDTGRLHSVSDTYKTVGLLKEAGFSNLSFDLISGLPGQTLEEFRHNLHETIKLGASQLSFYDLEIHEGTKWGQHLKSVILRPQDEESPKEKMLRYAQHDNLKLLNENQRLQFFQSAIEMMTTAGYSQYEVSTFAKPGFESRHNLIYWNNGEYLGLGPGAYSYLNGIRYQLARDVPGYLQKCESGNWKADVEDVLTDEQKEIETLMTGLRLQKGVDLRGLKFIRRRINSKIQQLIEENLLTQDKGRIFLTPRGSFLIESLYRFLIP